MIKLIAGDLVTMKSDSSNVGTVIKIFITTYSPSPSAEVAWFSGGLKGKLLPHLLIDLEKING